MATIDFFTDEEHVAVTAAVRRAIDQDRYPRSPAARAIAGGAGKAGPGSRAETTRRV
jgi:hypothetical protein